MVEVKNIKELSKGDKIVNISGDKVEIIEYLCKHPHHEDRTLFLNSMGDAAMSLNDNFLENATWYRYTDTRETWKEINEIIISKIKEKFEEDMAWFQRRAALLSKD